MTTSYEILPSLPSTGPLPTWIPQSFFRTGREGFVVRFTKTSGARWTGNFKYGYEGLTDVLEHPDGIRFLVIARGAPYLVDPESESGTEFGPGEIKQAWRIPGTGDLLIDRSGHALYRLDRSGLVWHTRRLSWDGFFDVRVGTERAWGRAWSPIPEDSVYAFTVDLESGRSNGGAPDAPREDWERLKL